MLLEVLELHRLSLPPPLLPSLPPSQPPSDPSLQPIRHPVASTRCVCVCVCAHYQSKGYRIKVKGPTSTPVPGVSLEFYTSSGICQAPPQINSRWSLVMGLIFSTVLLAHRTELT